MLYDSYMDSERYGFVHQGVGHRGHRGYVYTCGYTHGIFCCYKYKDTAEYWLCIYEGFVVY